MGATLYAAHAFMHIQTGNRSGCHYFVYSFFGLFVSTAVTHLS